MKKYWWRYSPIAFCSQCGFPFFAETFMEYIKVKWFGYKVKESVPCGVRRSVYDPVIHHPVE